MNNFQATGDFIDCWGVSFRIALKWMSLKLTEPYWWQVNISSGNGLMLSGSKSLPKPVSVRQQAITWASVDTGLCRHMMSPGHNELILRSQCLGKKKLTIVIYWSIQATWSVENLTKLLAICADNDLIYFSLAST